MELWQPHQVKNHVTYRASVGPLSLWVRRENDELHLATERSDDPEALDREEPFAEATPEDDQVLKWSRHILAKDSMTIRLQAILPDRSLVARPESALQLPPGRRAMFYVSMPVWIAVEEVLDKPVKLIDYPTVVLSNIWFGDTMSGELCYSLTTRARREVMDTERRPHRAVCVFEARNDSEESLNIQRLRVDAQGLALYDDGRRLWTNKVTARFKDVVQASEMEIDAKPPGEKMTLCSKARVPVRGSVFAKVFNAFRGEEEKV